MFGTTPPHLTLNDIIKKPNIPKIIVIGSGGAGKTTLVNRITNANFNTSKTSEDGTTIFQGASFKRNGIEILMVDSPGFGFLEDKWWDSILQIKNIIGVIVMHTYQFRNSHYGSFGYALAYLNEQKNIQVKKFLLDHFTTIDPDNYMAGSMPVKNSDHDTIYQKVREWIQRLDESNAIEINSPITLIKKCNNLLYKIDLLNQTIEENRERHETIISNHARETGQLQGEVKKLEDDKQIVKKSYEELEEVVDELPGELANYDHNTRGYISDAPHWTKYLYSWLPFVGVAHLYSLRTKAEKNHKIATRIIDTLKRKKKK